MSFWKRSTTLEALNQRNQGCMVGHVGIEFTLLGEDFIEATMPVDARTTQPFGLLHGGASVVLAETIGSMAGYLCCEGNQTVVGVEINASHMKSAREGHVRGVCRALRVGRRSQVWQINIFDSKGDLCCVSRLTTMVIDH